jgi:hypothetical protein
MRIAFIFMLLSLGCVNVFAQQPSDLCSLPRQTQDVLVVAFRVLNTEELTYYYANNRYATVAEITSTDEVKKLSANKRYSSQPVEGSIVIGSADDPLPGYEVHSIVGADSKSYSITATKKDGPCKGVGAATDERGLIYFIEPLR